MDTTRCSRWLRLALLLTALGQVDLAALSAQEKALPPELAVIPQDAAGFVQVRPADLWNGTSFGGQGVRKLFPTWADEISRQLGDDPADTESFTIVFPSIGSLGYFLPEVRAVGPVDPLLFVETTVKPMDQASVALRLMGAGAIEKQHQGKSYWLPGPKGRALFGEGALLFLNERSYLYAMSPAMIPGIIEKSGQPHKDGPLAAALAAAAKQHQLTAGVNLTEPSIQKQIKKLKTALERRDLSIDLPLVQDAPPWLLLALLDAQSASVSIEVQGDQRLRLHSSLTCAGAEQAEAAGKALDDVLVLLRVMLLGRVHEELRRNLDAAEDRQTNFFLMMLLKQAENALRSAKIETKQATVRVQAEAQFDLVYLRGKAKIAAENFVESEPVRRARLSRPMVSSLQQLSAALLDHHDSFGTLPPPAICSPDGKPLLSWRVAILPYLGETPLYGEFNRDEPWDSPHNIKLLPRMPKVFASPHLKSTEPNTLFQVIVGPGAVFELVPKKKSQFGARGRKLAEIKSFPHNLGIVEAAEPVPWTKPADVSFDAKQLPRLGGTLFPDGFVAAQVDGTIRFFKLAQPGVSQRQAADRGELLEETLRDAIEAAFSRRGPDWFNSKVLAQPFRKINILGEFAVKKEAPMRDLSKETVAAWQEEGATPGFMVSFGGDEAGKTMFSESRFRGDSLLAFEFDSKTFKPGVLGKVPAPDVGFGLALRSLPLTHDDFKDLARMKNLQMLDLRNTKVTDANLKELAGLKSLKRIALAERFGEEPFKFSGDGLRHLSSLEILDISGDVVEESLKGVGELRALRHIFLHGTKVQAAGLRNLAGLRLKSLSLSGGLGDEDLKELAGFDSLETLRLDGTKVTGAGFADLGALDSLKTLSLRHGKVNDAGVKELVRLTSLESLDLSNNEDVTDAGIKELANLRSLEVLKLSRTRLTDGGIKHLVGLKSLEVLIIEDVALTDAGLKLLAQMPSLQWIDIDHTKVTKAAVDEFRRVRPRVRVEIFFRDKGEK